MGSIIKYEGKRGVSWVIDYVAPDGKRVRQSFKTRKQAQAELTARDYTIQQGTYEDPRKYQKTGRFTQSVRFHISGQADCGQCEKRI